MGARVYFLLLLLSLRLFFHGDTFKKQQFNANIKMYKSVGVTNFHGVLCLCVRLFFLFLFF